MLPALLGLFPLMIVLAVLGHLWFCVNIWIMCSSSVKNVMAILIRITLNMLIALGSMAILSILILSVQGHEISFHFFESFSVPFVNFYSSQHISLSSPWSDLFLGIFLSCF